MIKQAVILAGGKGKRLMPLTKNIPKPMAPINNIPFLSYLIFSLKKKGIKKILLLVGYKYKKIIDHYEYTQDIPINFNYSSVSANTGKRVIDAFKKLDNEFLLLYGDNFWIPDLSNMYKKFKNKKAKISTTVFNNKKGTAEYGKENNIYIKKNSFVEKYDKDRNDKNLNGVDIGFFIVSKKFLKIFDDTNKNYSFEDDILTKTIEQKKLIAYRTDRQYFSITNINMLKKFEKETNKRNFGYIK